MFREGAGAGTSSTSRYLLKKEADLTKDAIGYAKLAEELAFIGDDGAPTPVAADVMANIREGSSNYAGGFTFKSTSQAEGRACDLYAYRAPSGGPAPTVDAGEMCLDPSLPWGIVLQKGEVKDEKGSVHSSYTMRLAASGSGGGPAVAAAAVEKASPDTAVEKAAKPAATAGPLTLLEAYNGEKVRLKVEVVPKSGGKKLRVTLENKSIITSADEKRVEVPGGGSATVELGQAGEVGAVEGTFTLTVYEGAALFQGSLTSDALK